MGITNQCSNSLCKDMLPIYTVEKPGFRKMLQAFDPLYEIPSRKYFSMKAIPAMYIEVKEKVAKELANIKFFASTTDLWSSETGDPYLCYTVHFVDDQWHITSHCL